MTLPHQPERAPRMAHEWLAEQRERKKIQQKEIEQRTAALGARITAATLGRIERGRQYPSTLSADQIRALVQVLGITPEEWDAHIGPFQPDRTQP